MVGTSPCASCKLLRRRCAEDCTFAPYFPSDDPHKFAIVHKVFGASNVSKMLQELPVHQRADAVSSLVYEANARIKDPVYGCVGAISYLQNQVSELQMQLAVVQAEILCIQMQQEPQAEILCIQMQQEPQAEILRIQMQQEPMVPTPPQMLMDTSTDDHHEKSSSYFLQANINNLPHQYLNFPSSTSSNVIHESLKRENIFGHDMVS